VAGRSHSISKRAGELLTGSPDELARIAGEIASFARLVRREPRVRAALTDIGVGGEAKRALLRDLFGGRVEDRTQAVLGLVVDEALGSEELEQAVHDITVVAMLAAAEADGSLEEVEDELFRFARIIDGEPALRGALTDPSVEADAKVELAATLLETKARPQTLALTRVVLETPYERDPAEALTRLAELAAERRGRVVVEARTAIPIDVQRRARLEEALSNAVGRRVDLEVVVDPDVVGGVVARVGDEIIDGSVKRKLERALEELTS
jgi:F-type H+-transporting ATPase subunit delta